MTVSVVTHGHDPDAPRDLAPWHYAIIKLRADGAFGCPRPRGHGQAGHLSLVDPDAAPDAERRARHWSETLRDAMVETGQSAPAATIESQAVLRVLAGDRGGDPLRGDCRCASRARPSGCCSPRWRSRAVTRTLPRWCSHRWPTCRPADATRPWRTA